MHSPCFVHSHLDKGVSLADWLQTKQNQVNGGSDVGVSKSLQMDEGQPPKPQVFGVRYPESTSSDSSVLGTVVDDEEDYGGSLTRQLAQTAVGVREMSKQLGE
jgi:NAD+ kinase